EFGSVPGEHGVARALNSSCLDHCGDHIKQTPGLRCASLTITSRLWLRSAEIRQCRVGRPAYGVDGQAWRASCVQIKIPLHQCMFTKCTNDRNNPDGVW
ncbi:hypothetical protein AVEN_141525-1, partial [Araneus ventricosus]